MKKNTIIRWAIIPLLMLSSCKYLDIVPDNVATIDYAFRLRTQAQKYLFTCYSYLPSYAEWTSNPALISGDEVWFFYPYLGITGAPPENWEIARGNQNIVSPYLNFWDGENGGKPMFQAIRDCNTFLDNIDKVPDMTEEDKTRWKGEVTFLKAYYNWILLRMYGPIPIRDKNHPVSASIDEVKVYRESVDSCFNYIVALIDSAAVTLPDVIQDPISEMGRVTRPIALAVKARVLMNAASPLFNGNSDYSSFLDDKGQPFFNQQYDPQKWEKAAQACKEAIDACHAVGNMLYHFNPMVNTYNLGPQMQTRMDIRNAVCEKWNSEIVWGATNSRPYWLQIDCQPIIDPSKITNYANSPRGEYAPSFRVAEQFYTQNGVPIDEDKTWDYTNRLLLDTAGADDKLRIKTGYVTAKINFDREPRFYADLGFDGGIWYGQGQYDENKAFHVEGRLGQYSGRATSGKYSITGYYTKKLVNFLGVHDANGDFKVQQYPWPIIRLADLYLYYAESLNEVNGPTDEVFLWIDSVRHRAGIPGVRESWSQFSKKPDKYQTKEGMREIIHRERLIEMAFEGNRFWDLRRWKESEKYMNQPIKGWNVEQKDPEHYYQQIILFNPSYKKRDYFWPIKENDIVVNPALVQNPGW